MASNNGKVSKKAFHVAGKIDPGGRTGEREREGTFDECIFSGYLDVAGAFANNRPRYQSLKLRDTEDPSLTLQSTREGATPSPTHLLSS